MCPYCSSTRCTVDDEGIHCEGCSASFPHERQKPYVCRECGHGFSTPHVRCIGTDGDHTPTVVTPLVSSSRYYDQDFAGAFDGHTVTSDADPGL